VGVSGVAGGGAEADYPIFQEGTGQLPTVSHVVIATKPHDLISYLFFISDFSRQGEQF